MPLQNAKPWHSYMNRGEVGSVMSIMRLFAAVVCLLFTGNPAGPAVTCLPPPPLCEAAARADLVFFGEVLQETTYVEHTDRGPLPQGIQAVRFNVIRAFKGVKPTEKWGLFHYDVEARPFKQGARYLVFAHSRATGAFVTGCTRTREIETADDSAAFRKEGAELAECLKPRR